MHDLITRQVEKVGRRLANRQVRQAEEEAGRRRPLRTGRRALRRGKVAHAGELPEAVCIDELDGAVPCARRVKVQR